MNTNTPEPTRVERFIRWVQEHPVTSTCIIIGMILGWLVQIDEVLQKLHKMMGLQEPSSIKHGTFTIQCEPLDMCAQFHILNGDTARWHNGVCSEETNVPGGPTHNPTWIKSDDWKEPFTWKPEWHTIRDGYRCKDCWSDPEKFPYALIPPSITITNLRVLNPEGPFRIHHSVPLDADGVTKAKGSIVLHFTAAAGTHGPTKALIVWDGTTKTMKN